MQIRITSLKSAYSFRNTAATAGIATIGSGRKTQKVSLGFYKANALKKL